MKKIVLILYTSHSAGPHVPFSDKKYQHCYEALYSIGESMGLHLCRAPLDWYDADLDIFRDSWEFVRGEWRHSGPIKPDLIYDRTKGRSSNDEARQTIISRYPFIDDPAFTRFANDKYATSQKLPQHFKPYQKFSDHEEFLTFLTSFTGERLVIKPVVGSGGQGVHIVSKEEAAHLELTFPIIVQEFIDSSRGIPGITNTYHDLRMVFIGEELVYNYVRTPKEGSLLANIAQGGNMTIVPTEKLPDSLRPIIDDTAALFAEFSQKTYTIDVMFDDAGHPWIIEYNTMPGMFFPPEEVETMHRVYTRLIQELMTHLHAAELVTAVIISTPQENDGTAPFRKDIFREAYTTFAEIAESNGVKLYRASTDWYDKATGSFRQAWHWDGTDWALASSIVPDVIYDKSATNDETRGVKQTLAKYFPLVNQLEFSAHAGSKLEVSRAFKEYTKPYHLVSSQAELAAVLEELPGDMVVAKPERGNSGEGVLIMKKSELSGMITFPALIQEFVDSSAGIPGIMTGLHDLRVIFSNEDFIYAYYRTPKTGSYLANLAQGGTQTMVSEAAIPATIWPLVKAVQKYYAKFPQKIYTIDFIFDESGRPWIVELNTMPGLYPDESERPYIDKLYLAIVETLKTAAKKK